jgi:coiled-coil domain-containing protein 130
MLSVAVPVLQAESYTAADAEVIELPDKEEGAAMAAADPLARLEKGVEDKRRGREGAERVAELREDSKAKYKDDYTINKALRRQLRFAALLMPMHASVLQVWT